MKRHATLAAVCFLAGAGGCGHGGHPTEARVGWDGSEAPAGPAPVRVVVADVDGDGVPDCVVLRRASASVAVLAGARGPRQTISLDGTYNPKPFGNRVFVWDSARDL